MPLIPSAEEIRRELVSLRSRSGISYARVRPDGYLAGMLAVDAEMRRSKRSADDRGAIAYDLVRCAACGPEFIGERSARITYATLNFDREDNLLEERRRRLTESLFLSYQAYLDAEEVAYRQLAGVLAGLHESPCSADITRAAAATAKRDGFAELQRFADLDARHYLEMAFERLTMSRTREAAVEEARRIFERIPGGRRYADNHYEGDEVSLFVSLVSAIRDAFWGIAHSDGKDSYNVGPLGIVRDASDVLASLRQAGLVRLRLLEVWRETVSVAIALEASDDWAALDRAPGVRAEDQMPARDPQRP